jgi:hypothetical protein
MFMKRAGGLAAGTLFCWMFLHATTAFAFGLKAQNASARIGAVLAGVVVLTIVMAMIRRFCAASFANGFTAATGLFLSFDIVVFHWVFQLHRITSGPEANILEPLFVIAGTGFLAYAWYKESRTTHAGRNDVMRESGL